MRRVLPPQRLKRFIASQGGKVSGLSFLVCGFWFLVCRF